MASDKLGLITALIGVLYDGKGKARANACATICNLAIATINKIPLANPTLGLVKALIHVIMNDISEARVNGCAALSYLAVAIERSIEMYYKR